MEDSKIEVEKITLKPKVSNTRYIIEKLFCHHVNTEVIRIEIQDDLRRVVSVKLLRECTLCGKSKSITI